MTALQEKKFEALKRDYSNETISLKVVKLYGLTEKSVIQMGLTAIEIEEWDDKKETWKKVKAFKW